LEVQGWQLTVELKVGSFSLEFQLEWLIKLRLGELDHFQLTVNRELESEASQLAAIYATIILNMRLRLDAERRSAAHEAAQDLAELQLKRH
jgi:hypothetical protein